MHEKRFSIFDEKRFSNLKKWEQRANIDGSKLVHVDALQNYIEMRFICTTTPATGRSISSEYITAAPGFRVFATMNHGGDFGKQELSPASSNRFT
jgi:hypothetical protein